MTATMMRKAISAASREGARMDAKRYRQPAHKREKYFGGYKERRQEAMARAFLAALQNPDHDTTAAVCAPTDDRTLAVSDWNAMIGNILAAGVGG